jgi:glycerol-3-phosphate dehydrogenase
MNPERSETTMERSEVVVIGGGIHGVGVAQAAAAAGYEVLLLEERDIAAGTSSRSSKLIHGGLRYLESRQFGLVHESLSERKILCRIAPELVKLVPFYVPVYNDTTRRPWELRAGLSLYAMLGHLRKQARFSSVPRSEWDALDGIETNGLQAVFRYYDGQTDDAALARAVLRSAEELGARVEVPATFVGAEQTSAGWRVRYTDGGTGAEKTCDCLALVNAAGPWVERVREGIEPKMSGFALDLVGGTHIELDQPLPKGVYYCEAPRDRRAVLIIPWKGRTLVGTTEQPFTGDPAAIAPTTAEIEYLGETLRHYFPRYAGKRVDAWAGLRVLPRGEGSAFSRPRETTLVVDDDARPRAVAIYGGKLTGYRATAERVMNLLERSLPARTRRGETRELPLTPQDRREGQPRERVRDRVR